MLHWYEHKRFPEGKKAITKEKKEYTKTKRLTHDQIRQFSDKDYRKYKLKLAAMRKQRYRKAFLDDGKAEFFNKMADWYDKLKVANKKCHKRVLNKVYSTRLRTHEAHAYSKGWFYNRKLGIMQKDPQYVSKN